MTAALVDAPDWVRALRPEATRVDVLGRRDGAAHVVRLGGPDGEPFVLKRYDDGRGPHAVRTMRAVHGALLATGVEAALAVPRVHRWHAHAGVMVQTAVPGRPLLALLATTRRRAALAQAARAIAALHTSGARIGPVTSMADHVADLIHPHPEVVARAVPALAPRIRRLVAALGRWQATAPRPAVPLHRDAHPRQMTLDGPRVWLVDWDLAARGDAALDVANFALYLRTRLPAHGDSAAELFLHAYLAHGLDVRDRLHAFTACMALRLVCKAWRLRRPGWRGQMTSLLTLAERAL